MRPHYLQRYRFMTSAPTANLNDIAWMIGPWHGALGEQTVSEDWSKPLGGNMSTMVRLCGPEAVNMIELIAIREEADSLLLHLRQFNPELSIVRDQNMPLDTITESSVKFIAPGEGIEALGYYQEADEQGAEGMRVEVTVTGGVVLSAHLQRP